MKKIIISLTLMLVVTGCSDTEKEYKEISQPEEKCSRQERIAEQQRYKEYNLVYLDRPDSEYDGKEHTKYLKKFEWKCH